MKYLIRKALVATVYDVIECRTPEDADPNRVDEMDGDVTVAYDAVPLTPEQLAAYQVYEANPFAQEAGPFLQLVEKAEWDRLRSEATNMQMR